MGVTRNGNARFPASDRLITRRLADAGYDCGQVGKVIWVAGHSGPETADDSRTHFGIYGPGVTQLFPDGHVANLYPYEYNEVPVLMAAAMRGPWPIIALHLTRPPIEIVDREALGMPSYLEAARDIARQNEPEKESA